MNFFKRKKPESTATGDELQVIYELFNELMHQGKFFEIDVLVSLMDPTNMDMVMALGVLTTTKWCESKLKNRTAFYNKVARRPDAKDRGLLAGLEPK
jgi:hypothetical protein